MKKDQGFFLAGVILVIWVLLSRPFVLSSIRRSSLKDSDVHDQVFHLPEAFKTDYEQMERSFKIFVYPNEDKDLFSDEPRMLNGKYGSEGYFFHNLIQSHFLTKDPEKAHLFFIPVSCHKLRRQGKSYGDIMAAVEDYVKSLISNYPYWNRTLGVDHFFVTCHESGATATELILDLVKNSIRVICSPSYIVQYIPHKDIALPKILQPFALPAAGDDTKNRTVLAFWAGRRNSDIRHNLVQVWQNDRELDIQNNWINTTKITGRNPYQDKFYKAKFCICPGAPLVHGARITTSIHYGCVPVILSDYTVLPFGDILNWRKFSVFLKEEDVYNLKQILKNITDEEYQVLQSNVVKVQKHFMWNLRPVRLDTFHMVLYDLWKRRHVVKY